MSAQVCASALGALCGPAKKASLGDCLDCVGTPSAVQKLEAAHCTQTEIKQFCT